VGGLRSADDEFAAPPPPPVPRDRDEGAIRAPVRDGKDAGATRAADRAGGAGVGVGETASGRRAPGGGAGAGAGAAAAAAGAKPRFVLHRPRVGPWFQFRDLVGYEWNRLELRVPGLPAELIGTRLLHVTDLHLRRRWREELDDLVARTQSDPPDVVLVTGDFVDDKRDHRAALPLVERLVKSIGTRHGIYCVVGNHDGDLLVPRLIGWGVHVIVHQRVELPLRGGRPVELIGLPGPDRVDLNERFVATQPPPRPGVPRIILCHYPDLIRAARPLAGDLYLAGHTHGGQMCLPNGYPLLTHDKLPHRLASGAHDVDGTCLLVGRGLGYTTLPVRLFCPAEVVEVELRANAEV
jgi:predicted MPP superfamily phosphohydrolase